MNQNGGIHKGGFAVLCHRNGGSESPGILRKAPIMNRGIKRNKGLYNLLIETFEFTDEQLTAIDYQIPMTQEIYDSVLDRCMELGTDADDLFYRMLLEYPDFLSVYAQKIEDEVNQKYADIDIPEFSPEEIDVGWEDLCRRIVSAL